MLDAFYRHLCWHNQRVPRLAAQQIFAFDNNDHSMQILRHDAGEGWELHSHLEWPKDIARNCYVIEMYHSSKYEPIEPIYVATKNSINTNPI